MKTSTLVDVRALNWLNDWKCRKQFTQVAWKKGVGCFLFFKNNIILFTYYEITSVYAKFKSVFIKVLKYPFLKDITCRFN